MAIQPGSVATKADYDALKTKVQNEVTRRQYYDQIPFSALNFNNNTTILASQQVNLADVAQYFNYTTAADVTSGHQLNAYDLAMIESAIDSAANEAAVGNDDCKTGCTGLCTGCTGGCATGCTSCTSCSGCSGSCSGCSGGCSGGCSDACKGSCWTYNCGGWGS